MRHCLDAFLKRLVKLAQRPLGFELLSDISIGPEPADNFASVVTDWLGTGQKPTIVPIATPQGKGVFPRLVALEAFLNVPDNALEMIWMMQFLPAEALHLLECGPRIVI